MDKESLVRLIFMSMIICSIIVLIINWRYILAGIINFVREILQMIIVSVVVLLELGIWAVLIGVGLLVLYGAYLGYHLVLGL